MFKGRFIEFFEVKGVLSMRNLTIFITILVASVVVLYLAFTKQITWEIFLGYLGAGGGVYSYGKYQDDKTRRSEFLNQQDINNDSTDSIPQK